MFDYYRSIGFMKKIGINGSGAESITKYQLPDIPFPRFSKEKEIEIVKYYHNGNAKYDIFRRSLDNFLDYDNKFNQEAGIYELDKSMKYLQEKLNEVINNIVNDIEVKIEF